MFSIARDRHKRKQKRFVRNEPHMFHLKIHMSIWRRFTELSKYPW